MTNKHDAVWEWLRTCPHICDMFFNASRAEDGNTQLVPSDAEVSRYIDGSTLRNYNVALTRFMGYSTDPNDEINITKLVDFDRISEWIDAQNDAGNYPEFPDSCRVTEVFVLPSQSGYMVAQDMSLAKYMLQFKIEYVQN